MQVISCELNRWFNDIWSGQVYNAFTDVPANNDTAFKEEIMTKTISFPVINLKSTGSNIESCRREAGLSVRDLQDYFGFEYPQAIYKWQHGECLPTVDNLLALSRILEVKMEDLLVYEDQEVSFLETGDGFLSPFIGAVALSEGLNPARVRQAPSKYQIKLLYRKPFLIQCYITTL